MDLQVDSERVNRDPYGGGTGVYVRAKYNDKYSNYDIAELTTESLLTWLRDADKRAENVVLILLGHPT